MNDKGPPSRDPSDSAQAGESASSAEQDPVRGHWVEDKQRYHGPDVPPGHLRTVVSYLEMTKPPPDPMAPLSSVADAGDPDGLSLVRAIAPDLRFYRFLYDSVGADWLWGDRRHMNQTKLTAILRDPNVEVHVLYRFGVPVGYVELDFRQEAEVEVAYFGLMPGQPGRGLGRRMMGGALALAWAPPDPASGRAETGRVWVHTCTLDHPRALGFYQAAGFTLYGEEVEIVQDPRVSGVIPPENGLHVPMAFFM